VIESLEERSVMTALPLLGEPPSLIADMASDLGGLRIVQDRTAALPDDSLARADRTPLPDDATVFIPPEFWQYDALDRGVGSESGQLTVARSADVAMAHVDQGAPFAMQAPAQVQGIAPATPVGDDSAAISYSSAQTPATPPASQPTVVPQEVTPSWSSVADPAATPVARPGIVTQVVTPQVEVQARVEAVSERQGDSPRLSFRISRGSVGATPLDVPYTISAHGSRGAPAPQERMAVIPAGAAYVDISLPATMAGDGGVEIVTLQVRGDGQYRLGRAAATLFAAGSPLQCSDAALLEAYRAGQSAEAFGALVERHRDGVVRACYRVVGNWADAEDVSQGVFLSLLHGPMRLHGALAGWLGTVAHHAAISFLRSRGRRSRHEQRAARPARFVPQEPTGELREELEAALSQLPAPLSQAVRLRYLEELSQADAARIVGCPRGTLSQRSTYGIQHLRNIVAMRDAS
jgi:RNA polymerase sigma factor (sigma-70 family)